MNKLKIMLIAMLGMVVAACSNDDMPGDSELDKLDQVENPNIKGYHYIHLSSEVEGLVIKEDGDYTIYLFNTAEQLAAAQISGSTVPGISFNPDFSESEMEKFWTDRWNIRKSTTAIEDFPDIDWSSQSLVCIRRKYSTTGMDLNKLTGKIYRNGGGFVITLQNEILFDMGYVGQAFTYCGFAVVVDKPNIQAKDLKIRLDNTEYSIYFNSNSNRESEKKTYSKWLKL